MANNDTTELCDMGFKYGTDKCPQIGHCYTPFYYELLKDKRQSVKKVLEMGVGNTKYYGHIVNYKLGSSLYMWRDFFPNAYVYGGDIVPESVFKDERIETFLCDARKEEDIVGLIKKTGSDIDLFIDDASHHVHDQMFLCQTVMPLLDKGVIYVIEDSCRTKTYCQRLSQYDCFIPELGVTSNSLPHDHIVIVKHKQ